MPLRRWGLKVARLLLKVNTSSYVVNYLFVLQLYKKIVVSLCCFRLHSKEKIKRQKMRAVRKDMLT